MYFMPNPKAPKIMTRPDAAESARTSREIGLLRDAGGLQPGWYWLRVTSREIGAGVYTGVPSEPGYFAKASAGTVNKLPDNGHVKPQDCIYVSPAAAEIASQGTGLLAVLVKRDSISYGARIEVHPDTGLRMPLKIVPNPRTKDLKGTARE